MPFEWVSKEARLKIIEVVLSSRSVKQLASELGVSPTAVRKYLNRRAYPSDEVVSKIIRNLAPYEKEKVYEILIDDLTASLKDLAALIDDDRLKNLLKSRVLEAVG
ncbi:helix-turn-helix domain-containing protein [Thermogladius sp. 4427co]|uniref:helix-turn-helix domain-containing protein n=1 Tax=Thermogladius sp. 4427co TaxID=3450718 RepID=UPI003F7AE80D